jgi:LPS sulfotransferase NodH
LALRPSQYSSTVGGAIQEIPEEWQQYFTDHGITPFVVVYEDFHPKYEETALEILTYLGINYPESLQFRERRAAM